MLDAIDGLAIAWCTIQIVNSTLLHITAYCIVSVMFDATDELPIALCTLQIVNSTYHILRCTLPITNYCLLHIIAYCIENTMQDATDGLPIVVDTTHTPPGMPFCLFFWSIFNIHYDDKIAELNIVQWTIICTTFHQAFHCSFNLVIKTHFVLFYDGWRK